MERYSAPRGHACMAASLLARKLYKTSPGTKKSGSPGPAGSCQFTRFPKDITSQVPSLEAFQNRCMHFIPVQWHFFFHAVPVVELWQVAPWAKNQPQTMGQVTSFRLSCLIAGTSTRSHAIRFGPAIVMHFVRGGVVGHCRLTQS